MYHFPLEDIFEQTKELIPNLSPITYTETLIYTDDIEEKSLENHLSPKENVSKNQIAEFFIDEIRRLN